MADPLPSRFDQIVDEIARSGRHMAFAAGYVRGEEDPVTRTEGDRYKGGGAVSASAPWHIGSITKGFTATLAMQLVDQGRLDLDAPIATYLPQHAPQMHPDWATLTMRALLSHTGGLRPNFTDAQMISAASGDLPGERLSRLGAHWTKPIKGKPGRYTYSNLGYALAGVVIEQTAGVPWEHLVRDRIAGPLGLTSLGTGAPRDPGSAWGHRKKLFRLMRMDPARTDADNPPWLGPAGTLHLSIGDLLIWGQAHLRACNGAQQGVVSGNSCLEMRKVVDADYALGWVWFHFPGRSERMIGHDGSNGMWMASFAILLERDLVLAFATNDGRYSRAAKSIVALGGAVLDAR